MTHPAQLDPGGGFAHEPAEITLFLAHLHANGQRVAEWPLEWVRHPTKKDQWVGVVMIENVEGSDEMSR